MCITELRLTCCPNEFTLGENKFKLLLLIDGGPGGCWEMQKTPCACCIEKEERGRPRPVPSVTFRTWKSLASLHRLQKRGSSRCSTVSLPNIVTTLHMICRGKHTQGASVRENITWLSGARPQDMSLSHHLKHNADAL